MSNQFSLTEELEGYCSIRRRGRVMLEPQDLEPSVAGFEVVGVFNPGAVEVDGHVYLLLRVAEAPQQEREGFIGLPQSDLDGGYQIEWIPRDQVVQPDPRGVIFQTDGRHRLTFVSHLRLARSRDGMTVDHLESTPALQPEQPYEAFGIEDPRITKIDGVYYITYVAVSEHGVVTALACTEDFRQFKRLGIIFPTENKDVVLFPERIEGQYVALHRPNGSARFGTPEIWIARSDDLIHWGRHRIVLSAKDQSDCLRLGAGAPPVRLAEGWLEIYHGVGLDGGEGPGVYDARGMLLDLADPSRLVYPEPARLFRPVHDFETTGFLNDVVFPSGCVCRGDDLYLYYGAGDTVTAVTVLSLEDLRGALRNCAPRPL